MAKNTASGETAKKSARGQAAKDSATLVVALNKHAAALNTHAQALNSHTAAMIAHTIALTPADARGACTIVFSDDTPDYCANNMTNRECQELAAEKGGTARPVVPGQQCIGE